MRQPKGIMVVRYEPGIIICFESEGLKYREFGPDEYILAKEIHYGGDEMSTGKTTKDDFFKALSDPIEISPLQDILITNESS